jgi:hypothetical protein
MRPIYTALIFLSLSCNAIGGVNNVHIVRTELTEVLATYIIPITPKEYNYKTVWRSPKGIKCSVSLLPQKNNGAAGGFECITPEKYKAQVELDCSTNISRESAMYLFFGQIGNFEEVGNFFVWCE